MDAFDANKNHRFAHEYKMAKIALTKFLKKDQPASQAWEQATCADIWNDLRGVTNALTKGKKVSRSDKRLTILLETPQLRDMIDQLMENFRKNGIMDQNLAHRGKKKKKKKKQK